MSVRERIAAIQRELLGDPLPAAVRSAELTLSALLSYVGREKREAELEYRRVLAAALLENKTAAAARIHAEATAEYARVSEAKGVEHEAEQMLITCRGYLRSLDTEMKMAR